MKAGKDIALEFDGFVLVHQNLRNYQKERHDHDWHEIFFPLKGEIQVATASKNHALGPGKMLFIPAKLEHSFASSSQQGERLIFLLDPKKFPAKKFGLPAELCIGPAHQLVKEMLFFLLLNPKNKHAKLFIQTLVITLGETLAESSPANAQSWDALESKVQDPRVERAMKLLGENVSEDLSMAELARKAGMSLRNFNRLFLTETGHSPKKLLLQLRVAKAESLLREGRKTVTEVAFEVGFNSLPQFIGHFRKITGSLPSDY